MDGLRRGGISYSLRLGARVNGLIFIFSIQIMNTTAQKTMHQLKWSGFHINIEWEPEAFGGIIAHLEIRSENSYPIPITRTGYLSHFTHKAEVMQHG